MTIVDIHCHTFNGDDLPVHGFVRAVAGQRSQLAKALAWSLDKVTQGMASGAEENAQLDRLLAAGPGGGQEGAEEPALSQADEDADELLDELNREDPLLADAAGNEAALDHGSASVGGPGDEGFRDVYDDLRRYLKWAALFGKNRLALTRAMISAYGEVDLFTPMLVDFQGLRDRPKTGVLEQLELQEKISRLGILGHLDAQVLPFVGFDPRRAGGVALVQEAVRNYGCVGVKLYPPMGFLPWRNRDSQLPGMSRDDALVVDAALAELYGWCADNDLPITAHSNPTQFANENYRNFSNPDHWEVVLKEWPDLHLNLGHFGWSGFEHRWPQRTAALTAEYPGLYADIGNHDLADLTDTISKLQEIFAASAMMRDRFMFGSDWYMVASHRDFEQFLVQVRDAYAGEFPEQLDRFMGGAALSFLGFDDPENANNQRTRARYQHHKIEPPAWLQQEARP